jgi:hypothetical protein
VDENLVSVFKTEDPGLLPLAEIALESAGIEYQARSAGKIDNLQWTLSQKPTTRPVVMEIMVASDVAAQARELLADLNQSSAVASSDPALLTDSESQAIKLVLTNTNITLASLTEEQLQTLGSHLEESGPQQFLVDFDAISRLRHTEVDPQLIDALEKALGENNAMTISWSVGA